jgi:MFS family permease
MGIFAPFVGLLVDRFGPRKLILLGSLTVGTGLLLLSQTQSLIMFYGSFLVIAFGGGGCAAVVLTTAVANWFRKKVGVALGIITSGIGAGGLMIPLIVWLIDVYGWRTTLIIQGLGMWLLGIPLSFVIRNKPEQYGYLPDGAPADAPGEPADVQSKEAAIGLKGALKERSFLYLNIAEFIRIMIASAVVTHVMPYLSSLGMPRSAAAMIAGAIPLISIVGRFGSGWLADIFPKRYVIAGAYSLGALGLLAFSYLQLTGLLVPFMITFPFFYGAASLRGAILRENFGRAAFGRIFGILIGVSALGGIIGPTLAGWVFDSLGSYQMIWLVFTGLIGLAIGMLLRMR